MSKTADIKNVIYFLDELKSNNNDINSYNNLLKYYYENILQKDVDDRLISYNFKNVIKKIFKQYLLVKENNEYSSEINSDTNIVISLLGIIFFYSQCFFVNNFSDDNFVDNIFFKNFIQLIVINNDNFVNMNTIIVDNMNKYNNFSYEY